jgi:hypothetical protein
MHASYFTTADGRWFLGTEHARGPWDVAACHAGPPTALMVRELERTIPHQRLARITVEVMRPIPLKGFRVQAEVRRPGRSVTLSEAEIFDDDYVFARAFGVHTRQLSEFTATTAPWIEPRFEAAVPGRFPIRDPHHDLPSFIDSVEVRYDLAEGSAGVGGPTTMWLRPTVSILPDEEPSPFQRICPLADCGNGVSYNEYLDRVAFLNVDLTIALHRDPVGEWHAARTVSHWQDDGTGLSDAELFDTKGVVGRALQTLLLTPVA